MEIILVLIISVSLSMDAFSLSLAYGTLNLDKPLKYKLTLIVAFYHFFMPLLGMFVSTFIPYNIINSNVLVFIILTLIGVQMILESKKDKEYKRIITLFDLLLFGLAVSLDSFSVGLGLKTINENFIMCSSFFSVCSGFLTYIGLILGSKINKMIGSYSTILGGLVLVIIGITYLFN